MTNHASRAALPSVDFYALYRMYFVAKNKTTTEYFLGGRSSLWVIDECAGVRYVPLAADQGLPGAAYLSGISAGWIGIGARSAPISLLLVAKPLPPVHQGGGRRAITLPGISEPLPHDESGWISVVSAVFILVFFLFYTASGFVSCAKLFSSVFGIPYLVSLTVGAVVVISYTFAGGFLAVCWTDFFQGLMMFFCVVAVPLIAIFRMGGPAEFISSVEAFNANFLSMFVDGATNTPYTALGIVSLVAWGLGYFGQPHILVRFMGISSPAAIKKSRRIATVWVVISLTAAVMIGVSGRMVLGDGLLDGNGQQEIIYITMVSKFFPLFIAGIFLSAILAAIMSTADSQLLVTASALTKDFYHNKIRPQATEKGLMWVSRGCVMGVAVIAVLIATNQNSTVLGLVSYAWGGFGSAFGPLVLCSLFWKRTNKQGGMQRTYLVGSASILVWAQLSGGIFDLYEIVPGFVCGLIAISSSAC